MAYTHTTFGTAKTLLAARLGDPSKVFWTDTELGLAIIEAKRIWNAITLQDRESGNFSTVDGTSFYQLADVLVSADDGVTFLRDQTVRDRQLVTELQYHLVEPATPGGWTGTDQFTLSQVLTALQRRRDQFLADTACVVVERTDTLPAGTEYVDLPDTVIGTRRVVARNAGGRYTTLRSSDSRGFSAWPSYHVATTPNLRINLTPPFEVEVTLETVTVETGVTLSTTANGNLGTLVGIPDDLTWGIKYGALGDLLRDGQSTDPGRAELCEQMYMLAVQIARNLPVVLSARISGAQVTPGAIATLDTASMGWQGLTRTRPDRLAVVAPDMVAIAGVPDNDYMVTLEVVRTAKVPTADNDYLEIGREHLDALLGMAQRFCMLKVSGQELGATEPLADKFFGQATMYSYRRSAASTAIQAVTRVSARAMETNRWVNQPTNVDDVGDEVRQERNARRRGGK